jgi:hypothetical protein
VPAICRDGSDEKTVGASTKERKTIPPIQTVRERSIRKRSMDMGAGVGSQVLGLDLDTRI